MKRCIASIVVSLLLVAIASPVLPEAREPARLKAQDVFDPHELHIVHLLLSAEAYRNMAPEMRTRRPGWLEQLVRRAATQPARPATRPATRPVHPIDQKADELWAKDKVAANAFGIEHAYVRGKFVFNGRAYDDVGIRWKGNSSYALARATLKKPLKIDFNRFREDQEFHGLKQINLSNNALDPSQIRESLSYWAFRQAALPAPRTTFALVYLTIEGQQERQCLGVYTLIEEVDGEFLKSRFGGKDGLLLKPEGAHDLTYRGNEWDRYSGYDAKTRGTPELRQRLIDFLWLIHQADAETFNREMNRFLDPDAFLRFLAVNALLSNMDSFLSTGHNFYLHIDPAIGKLTFLPWDMNLSVGGYLRMGNSEELTDLSILRPHVGRGTLIERVLAMPGMKQRYLDHVRAMMDDFFNIETLGEQIAAMEKAVAEGERLAKEFSQDGPAKPPSFAWWKPPPTPMSFMTRRVKSVQEQLAGKTLGYVPRHRTGPLLGGGRPRPANPPAFAGALFKALNTSGDVRLSADEVVQPALAQFDRAAAQKPQTRPAAPRLDDPDRRRRIMAGWREKTPATRPAGSLDLPALTHLLSELLPRSEGRVVKFRGESAAAVLARTLLYEVDRDQDAFLTRQELRLGLRRLFGDADINDDTALTDKEFADGLAKLFSPPRF